MLAFFMAVAKLTIGLQNAGCCPINDDITHIFNVC